MVCCVVKNTQIRPVGGNSGSRPYCATTPAGSFIGDSPMKRIPLTQGQFALVDDEDFERLSKLKWQLGTSTNCQLVFAVHNYGFKRRHLSLPMHRYIMKSEKNDIVDHINKNGLDNRKKNLRKCSKSNIESQKPKMKKQTSSKYKGVSFNKKNGNWTAQTKFNRKMFHLGSFSGEIEAAKAYDKKARELFGEFACLNFPKKQYGERPRVEIYIKKLS